MQISIKNVMLSTASKRQLRKIKDNIWGNVVNAIECPEWYIPSDTIEYVDVRDSLIDGIREMFNIDKDILIEVEYFETNMLSFTKGVYPNYEYARKHRRK